MFLYVYMHLLAKHHVVVLLNQFFNEHLHFGSIFELHLPKDCEDILLLKPVLQIVLIFETQDAICLLYTVWVADCLLKEKFSIIHDVLILYHRNNVMLQPLSDRSHIKTFLVFMSD